jgi:hypothetical protein
MTKVLTLNETITHHAIISKSDASHNASSNIMQVIGVMLGDKGAQDFTAPLANHSLVNITFMLSKNGVPVDIVEQKQVIRNDVWLHAHDMLILSTVVLANAHETQLNPFSDIEFDEIQALGDELLDAVVFEISVTATVITPSQL